MRGKTDTEHAPTRGKKKGRHEDAHLATSGARADDDGSAKATRIAFLAPETVYPFLLRDTAPPAFRSRIRDAFPLSSRELWAAYGDSASTLPSLRVAVAFATVFRWRLADAAVEHESVWRGIPATALARLIDQLVAAYLTQLISLSERSAIILFVDVVCHADDFQQGVTACALRRYRRPCAWAVFPVTEQKALGDEIFPEGVGWWESVDSNEEETSQEVTEASPMFLTALLAECIWRMTRRNQDHIESDHIWVHVECLLKFVWTCLGILDFRRVLEPLCKLCGFIPRLRLSPLVLRPGAHGVHGELVTKLVESVEESLYDLPVNLRTGSTVEMEGNEVAQGEYVRAFLARLLGSRDGRPGLGDSPRAVDHTSTNGLSCEVY